MEQIPLPVDQVIGKRYLTVFPLALKHGLFDGITRVMETKTSETHEVNSPVDPTRWFIVHYTPLDDGVTTTFIEITEYKKLTRALELKNQELERSNAELAAFSYVASHDLNEPLRKIHIFSQRIIDKGHEQFAPEIKEYFKRIMSASERMRTLLGALLDYSRANSAGITFESIDLNAIVKDVTNELREMIEESKVSIETSVLPTLNLIPHQINQLFLNIFTNAIKYRRTSVMPFIRITAEMVSAAEMEREFSLANFDYWKIQIADNGIGFEQRYEDKIFELFQRLHGRSEYEGTGVGLAICKRIAQNHGGFIKAIGEPDVGAIFSIYFPVTTKSS